MNQGKRTHSPRNGETAAETAALVRQPRGGALLRGGKVGNKGGPGRPRDEFKQMMAALASDDAVIDALRQILSDPGHPSFLRALEYATDRGYGGVPRADSPETTAQLSVVIRRELPDSSYETRGPGLLGAGDEAPPNGDH